MVRARSNMNERSDLSIAIETTTPPRPRRSKRGKTGMISSGGEVSFAENYSTRQKGRSVFRSTKVLRNNAA